MKTADALKQEDAKLARLYVEVDAWLVKRAASGLDTATDRRMKNTNLAWQLVDGTL